MIHLPLDYPRINQFPEWFTVEADARYEVRLNRSRVVEQSGVQLAAGLSVKLGAGETIVLEVGKR